MDGAVSSRARGPLHLTGQDPWRSRCQSCPVPAARTLPLPADAPVAGARTPTAAQAFAGIVTVSVGHCHPKVTQAIVEQTQRLQHTTTIYLHHQVAQYAQELAERMPGNLKVRAGHG